MSKHKVSKVEGNLFEGIVSEICGDEFEPILSESATGKSGTLEICRLFRKPAFINHVNSWRVCILAINMQKATIIITDFINIESNREWELADPNSLKNAHDHIINIEMAQRKEFFRGNFEGLQ